MNESDIKKLLKKSEINTTSDFTDKLMSKIQRKAVYEEPVNFWSLRRIIMGFLVVTLVSGFLVYKISQFYVSTDGVAIPFVWSLLLLLGLNYLLSVNSYKVSLPFKN